VNICLPPRLKRMEVDGRNRYVQDEGNKCARVLARYISAATVTNVIPSSDHSHPRLAHGEKVELEVDRVSIH
jgi:hypothetical protein